MRLMLVLAAALVGPLPLHAVTIDTVPVGHPGNPPDFQPEHGLFGTVLSSYRIATTPITNAQYTEFLNAVAADDPYGLYNPSMGDFLYGGISRDGSPGNYTYTLKPDVPGEGPGGTAYTYGDKPVIYVTWFNAIRFANWMHNGQSSGDTESGAYTLEGGTPIPSNANGIVRDSAATWFLPTEDEWYKAAYYDGDVGVYYTFPTGTDDLPDNNLPSADSGNSANFSVGFQNTTGSEEYPYTSVGAYTLSASPYGTFDQGGNVWEWNETWVDTNLRGRRGGSWIDSVDQLASSHRDSANAALGNAFTGFRLATIPEPEGIPGDFNGDGVVDAADYVWWRSNDGTTAGYEEWRANFGMTVGGGQLTAPLVTAAVPEPAAWLLSLAFLLWLTGCRRCRV